MRRFLARRSAGYNACIRGHVCVAWKAPAVYTSARHDRFVRMSPGVSCRVRRLPYHDGGAKGFVTGRSSACVSRRMCCIRAGIARGAFGRDGPVQRQPVP